MPRKCVFGCESAGNTFHVFPNPDKFPERFRAWVNSVGGKLETPSDFEYFRKKRVCDLHFKDADRNRFNRLNALAIPTPICQGESVVSDISQQNVSDQLNPVPSTSFQTAESMVSEVNVSDQLNPVSSTSFQTAESMVSEVNVSDQLNPVPSTSFQTAESMVSEVNVSDQLNPVPSTSFQTAKSMVSEVNVSDQLNPVPSTSFQTAKSMVSEVNVSDQLNPVPSTSFQTAESLVSRQIVGDQLNPVPSTSWMSSVTGHSVIQEHNYFKSLNTYRRKSPRLSMYRQHTYIKNLKKQVKCLQKRGASFKLRLERAEKMETCIEKVTKNMSKAAQIFTLMQFKGSCKKNKGRRFTLEEKVLSLSYYKRSPKLYRMMAKNLILPSVKTMKRLLSEVKLKSGINTILFEKIKNTVNVMDMEDRLCTLIFDEMSITPNINYNAGSDTLIGLADYGQHPIADHALVFMVKGIKKIINSR